ncbi:MAG: SAM-dependent methyltransferase, partial [Hyphomicrobiales bacterium]
MQLFDRALLRARQARAAPGLREHGFLHARAAEDIRLRLDAVMRDFPMALEFSTFPDRLPPALLDHPRVGELVVASPDIGGLRAIAGLRVACDEEQLPFAPQAFPLA